MASKKVPTPIVPLDPNILKLYQRGLHAYDQGKFEQAAELLKQGDCFVPTNLRNSCQKRPQ